MILLRVTAKIIHKLQDFFSKNISDVWMISTYFYCQLFMIRCTTVKSVDGQ